MRVQMRHGDLSRTPLHLLRFHLEDQVAECDWLACPADIWDRDLRLEIGHRHESLQTLKDAIDVRAVLFAMIPELETARLRAYRESAARGREVIISGEVQRRATAFRNVRSVAMRAKLMGFRFNFENEVLCSCAGDEAQGRCS
jgi:hypothetical protein